MNKIYVLSKNENELDALQRSMNFVLPTMKVVKKNKIYMEMDLDIKVDNTLLEDITKIYNQSVIQFVDNSKDICSDVTVSSIASKGIVNNFIKIN